MAIDLGRLIQLTLKRWKISRYASHVSFLTYGFGASANLCHYIHLSFQVGDWVRVKATVSSPKYGWDDVTRTSIGVVHSLEEEGDMGVGFCFRSRPFSCSLTDMEKVAPFTVGQELHVKSSVSEPRLGWCGETSATTGKIARIDMDGTLNVSV